MSSMVHTEQEVDRFLFDAFVSHNGDQKPWVRALVRQWESNGLRVFFDEKSIEPGALIDVEIRKALKVSRHIILVISPSAVASPWVAMEVLLALDSDPTAADRRLIPILLEPTDLNRIPSSIRDRRRIDLTNASTRRKEYNQLLAYLNVEKKLPVPKLQPNSRVSPRGSSRRTRVHAERLDSRSNGEGREPAPRASVRASFSETGRLYELVIDGDIDSFSPAQQDAVVDAVNWIVKGEGEIRVLDKRAGSVRLTMRLTDEQADHLRLAIEQGLLADLGVIGLDSVESNQGEVARQKTLELGVDREARKIEDGLKMLIDLGKRRGFLTFDQVNDYLPDEAASPERIHGLLETLDEMGIELINEDEVESRLPESGERFVEPEDIVDELEGEDAELTSEDLDDISPRADDPVRTFLAQMAQIPLLTREQEINLAKRIEITRIQFPGRVLECHFALAVVVDMLKKVNEGELSFDRTVKVSVTENLEKDQIRGRMAQNLVTLIHLMECNIRDFRSFVRERDAAIRLSLLEDLTRRRREAVILVEELSIRTQRVPPLMKRLEQISARMGELVFLLKEHRSGRAVKEERADLVKELKDLMRITLETPKSLAKRVKLMKTWLRKHKRATRELSGGDLRLVILIARKYRNRGLSFLDLIREGNAGLMRAAGEYDYRRGYEFRTYATWWIRQAITRAIADQARTTPIPEHIIATMSKLRIVSKSLLHENGREPTIEETARAANISVEETRRAMEILQHPISLDRPIGESEDSGSGDFIGDEAAKSPINAATSEMLRKKFDSVLIPLTQRERAIITLRYALGGGHTHTLEEVSRIFGITRDCVRRIERRTFLRRILNPVRHRGLEGFLEGAG